MGLPQRVDGNNQEHVGGGAAAGRWHQSGSAEGGRFSARGG